MKFRLQAKTQKGKKRWSLVSSYRDGRTPRTKIHAYLGLEPNEDIRRKIAVLNKQSAEYKNPRFCKKWIKQIVTLSRRQRADAKTGRQKLIGQGKRGRADGASPPIEPFGRWMAEITSSKVKLEKSLMEKPIDQRSEAQLRDFLSDTQYIEDYRERVKAALDEIASRA